MKGVRVETSNTKQHTGDGWWLVSGAAVWQDGEVRNKRK